MPEPPTDSRAAQGAALPADAAGPADPVAVPERLLILLSPPRSFSSVVSTMIGQHPALYGFPELHLFIGDTVREVLEREYAAGNYFGPPGLLRAIAELEFGVQTQQTIAKSIGWLAERRLWSTKEVMDALLARIAPRIGVEKSPITAHRPLGLERAWAFYPKAQFLHLTRHPVSNAHSMDVFLQHRSRPQKRPTFNSLLSWWRFHRNILDFTRSLPPGQSLMIKGEDILSDPDRYLPQIAQWLGVCTDDEAIAAMKRPEQSPYAYRGPAPAHGGNDGNFMRNPVFRPGPLREPSLKDFFATAARQDAAIEWINPEERARLSQSGYAFAEPAVLMREVTALARRLGYH
jgi:hypothetical protein